ncbi:MAG: IS1 family transposase [Deltaproteobacteria bacterium]|nr:IS1 family transposase [Deltaproteobacteria bacterium]
MNTLPRHKKVLIIRCLTEGMSLRAVARIADVSRNTVAKLLVDAGAACAEYQDRTLRNLPCRRIQADEIWSFVYAKAKNVHRAKSAPPEAGDVWTWTAICADTKLVPSWRLGDRSAGTALDFMDDLKGRLANRVQLTTDGHRAYLEAVEEAFGADVDYAMLVKLYGKAGDERNPETRYSPSECTGTKREVIEGDPDDKHVSTSYVERQNLTMRMSMRRFTRLTNAFSKRLEYLSASVALHFMHYNFCRIHQTLRVTPAMEAGVTDRLWEISDIVDLVDAAAPKPNRPATYRKRGEISN